MKKYPVKMMFGVFLSACMFAAPASAKISIPSFNGVLLITQPSGEIVLLNPGETVPDIPNGATLELFNGDFQVDTAAGDSVSIACFGHTASIKEGAGVSLSCDDNSCLLKVKGAAVIVTAPDGTPKEVPAGEGYRIEAEEAAAFVPPDAEGGPAGPVAAGPVGEVPVDSRSIDASPGA